MRWTTQEKGPHVIKCITKTCLYNFDPLKPHFYIVKLGFRGVYIIFLISAKKHRSLGGSNEYPQSMTIEFLRLTVLEFQALQAKVSERPSVRPSVRL